MWFEIIPSFAIITVAMALPGYCLYGLHKGILGNAYRRCMDQRWDRHQYQRDYRLTGHPYVVNGLEILDDEK